MVLLLDPRAKLKETTDSKNPNTLKKSFFNRRVRKDICSFVTWKEQVCLVFSSNLMHLPPLLVPGALYTAQLHYPPTTLSNYKIEVIAREKECPEISN